MPSANDSPAAASSAAPAPVQPVGTNAGSQASPDVAASSGAAVAASSSQTIVVSTVVVRASAESSSAAASVSRATAATVPTGGAGQIVASKGVLSMALLIAGAVVAL